MFHAVEFVEPRNVFSFICPAWTIQSMVVMVVTCMFNKEESVVMTFTTGQLFKPVE